MPQSLKLPNPERSRRQAAERIEWRRRRRDAIPPMTRADAIAHRVREFIRLVRPGGGEGEC